MNKSLSYVNFSLELHVVSTFWLGSDPSGTFSLHFAHSSYMNLRDQPWKMLILWCRTDICCKFSAKLSLMLDNPFLVQSFYKLNHISLCFIQISTKSPEKLLIPFRESNEVIHGVLSRQENFNITWRFLLRLGRFLLSPCFQTICFLWLCYKFSLVQTTSNVAIQLFQNLWMKLMI